MPNVVKFAIARRARADHQTLCRSGFHKWQLVADRHFDVKRGKLLTAERCRRCGEQRTRLL